MEKLNVYRSAPSSSVSGSRNGAESVNNLKKKKGPAVSKFVSRLAELGYDLSFNPKQTAGMLTGYALEICGKNYTGSETIIPEAVRHLATAKFNGAWTGYIADAEREFYDSGSRKDRLAYLAKFAAEYGKRSYGAAADAFMLGLISSRPKLKLAGARRVSRSFVGPNEPCPCGSGLKYKNCCGRPKPEG